MDQASVDGIEAAMRFQAESAAQMLAALVHAHALPLTSMLSEWWNKLKPADMDAFSAALARRVVEVIVERGDLDALIKSLAHKRLEQLVSEESIEKLVGKALDEHGEKIVERKVETALIRLLGDRPFDTALEDGMNAAIEAVAKECTMAEREVIAAAVRDKMPSIEEMTQKILADASEDMSREIRARLRKSDTRDE